MKLTLLGTGNPTPSLNRMGSGYLLEIADDVIVIDHGPGAHHRLLETGTKPTEVTHMMFSHLHYDHCIDFPRLLLTRWDFCADQIPELQVFGPPPTAEMVDRLVGEKGAFRWDIDARANWPGSLGVHKLRGGNIPRQPPQPVVNEYISGDVIETDNWKLSLLEVPHAQPYLTCLAMRFDTDEGSFVYSGDTGRCSELEEFAKDCDLLLHMCVTSGGLSEPLVSKKGAANHIEAAQAAQNAGAKMLVTTHIYDQYDVPGHRERLIAEMAGIFDGTIIYGQDLLDLGLTPPAPGIPE